MEAYGYFLHGIIVVAWIAMSIIVLASAYVGGAELYDAIKQDRISWSHIQAAFFVAAGYVINKVTRAKNAGRHAVNVKKDVFDVASFWQELNTEFEARPYSLSRANRSHRLA